MAALIIFLVCLFLLFGGKVHALCQSISCSWQPKYATQLAVVLDIDEWVRVAGKGR